MDRFFFSFPPHPSASVFLSFLSLLFAPCLSFPLSPSPNRCYHGNHFSALVWCGGNCITHAHTLCVGSFFARVIEALNPSVIFFFVVVKTKAGKAQRKLSPPLLNGV